MYESRGTAFSRVVYDWPGKHGDHDLRVSFVANGLGAPSLPELLAMIWGMARAEDRYDGPNHQGRFMLKRYVDEVFQAQSWPEARSVIVRAAESIRDRSAV